MSSIGGSQMTRVFISRARRSHSSKEGHPVDSITLRTKSVKSLSTLMIVAFASFQSSICPAIRNHGFRATLTWLAAKTLPKAQQWIHRVKALTSFLKDLLERCL